MARRRQWSGTASDFLRAAETMQREEVSIRRPDWPRTPRALAGRLRRAQTSLRAVGIHIDFHREGRAGNRMINMRLNASESVASVNRLAPVRQRRAQWRDVKVTTPFQSKI